MLATPVHEEGGMSIFSLFARQECVNCQSQKAPDCPATCPEGETCRVTAYTCQTCPKSFCAKDDSLPAPTPTAQAVAEKSSSTNTGAIAGGVAGGIAVIAIITYLVWRFCIKTKRGDASTIGWDGQSQHIQRQSAIDAEKSFDARRDQRASTHTVNSIASTVLTRASNIIQIAYIPGVTNRAAPSSPNVLVPPVPPIPINISGSGASTPAATEDQHFFVPGDLRDSTYSGVSGYTDRTSYARTSYAPRSSIASTIYGKSAVVISPAQTGMRAKPAMVSVKSVGSTGSGTDSGANTPPVPSVDFEKYGPNNGGALRPPSPANSTFSVGSTFLNNASAHTAMPARAMMVRVGSGAKKVEMPSGPMSERDDDAASAAISKTAKQGHTSEAYTLIDDSPVSDQGPFSDPPLSPSGRSTKTGLSAVIEEATRMASQRDSVLPPKTPLNQAQGRSPFSDSNRSSR